MPSLGERQGKENRLAGQGLTEVGSGTETGVWLSGPRARSCHRPCAVSELLQKDHYSYFFLKEAKHEIAPQLCLPAEVPNHLLASGRERHLAGRKRHGRGGRSWDRVQQPRLGKIQRGPARRGRGRSGTRVWPAAGTRASGHGPRWPRRRGARPKPTGAGSTGGGRKTSCPGTRQRE